jgi:hypothetical protein
MLIKILRYVIVVIVALCAAIGASTIIHNFRIAPPNLWVLYQAWSDDHTFTYRWNDYKFPKEVTGDSLNELSAYIKTHDKIQTVVILEWKRFEK